MPKSDHIQTVPKEFWPEDTFGKKIPQVDCAPFITGVVVRVQSGEDNPVPITSNGLINSIYALPHGTTAAVKKEVYATLSDEFLYHPLIRGINDVPDEGDQVLLCNFGGRNYYLGPLNTAGSPNDNPDHLRWISQLSSGEETGDKSSKMNDPGRFDTTVARLSKRLNPALDNPLVNKPIPEEGSDPSQTESQSDENNEDQDERKLITTVASTRIPSDLVFEGKFGNSIRFGARNIFPHLMFSNGRAYENPVEGSLDGSIMTMFSRGTVREHFIYDSKVVNKGEDGLSKYEVPYLWSLADEEVPEEKLFRCISKTFQSSLGRGLGPHKNTSSKATGEDDPNIGKTIYGYNGHQIWANSDRITFNARKESIFLSAHQFLHIGAVNNVNISTSNTCLVEAACSMIVNTPLFKVNAPGKVYIDGRKNTNEDDELVGSIFLGNPALGDRMSPAVLGDALVSFIVTLIEEIKLLAFATSEAIENHQATGASYDILSQRAEALESLLGLEDKQSPSGRTYKWPKVLWNMILSDSVMIKK